jgi:hypothetical protein
MGNSTARYRFEFRLFERAEAFSRLLTGGRTSIFIGLRTDGTLRRIYLTRPGESFDGEAKTQLVEAHASWALYVPHAEPGSGYLEWFELDRRAVERWLGERLEEADFIDVRARGQRDEWPRSWRVLFG